MPFNGFELIGQITEEEMMECHVQAIGLCPMCGCIFRYGCEDWGYGGYREVLWCPSCDYQEY